MLWPRWLFLRAVGLIFLSAFYSLAFQIQGLIGEHGILPADAYLRAVARAVPGFSHYWLVPTVLWSGAGDWALAALVAVGAVAATLLTLNVSPRVMAGLSTVAFLSCATALQDFSSYQSDSMLLQAGVAAVLLAPKGWRPRLGAATPPSRASVWLLRWEWFAIYFESGLVKLMSGDVQWRTLSAMDHYYEDSPLPAWPGWYAQQLPHAFHAGTVLLTFALELVGPWVLFAPRRARLVAAGIVTVFQISIIVTSNYAFLNCLVLALGAFLLDDASVRGVGDGAMRQLRCLAGSAWERMAGVAHWPRGGGGRGGARIAGGVPAVERPERWRGRASALVLVVTVYVGLTEFAPYSLPDWARAPARWLAPFRVANAYGLYAVMTTAEYEIEFQGLGTDSAWVAYPFRYKPQDPAVAPAVYTPYQPRFEWNLWFASLGSWSDSPWVVSTQIALLNNDPSVLRLFARNPFAGRPPEAVRSVLWRYWFTDRATRRRTGQWWNRELIGAYGGTVTRSPDGGLRFAPPGS